MKERVLEGSRGGGGVGHPEGDAGQGGEKGEGRQVTRN